MMNNTSERTQKYIRLIKNQYVYMRNYHLFLIFYVLKCLFRAKLASNSIYSKGQKNEYL